MEAVFCEFPLAWYLFLITHHHFHLPTSYSFYLICSFALQSILIIRNLCMYGVKTLILDRTQYRRLSVGQRVMRTGHRWGYIVICWVPNIKDISLNKMCLDNDIDPLLVGGMYLHSIAGLVSCVGDRSIHKHRTALSD